MMEVTFRKIERSDLEMVKNWRNQERILKNSRDRRVLTMEDQVRWFERISSSGMDDMYIILRDGVPVGVCGLGRLNCQDRTAEITYYLGVSSSPAIDVTLGVEVYDFLKKKGFMEYRLNRLHGEVFGFNEGGLRLALHCGFKNEGIKRQSVFWDGKYWDSIMVGLLAEEYRLQEAEKLKVVIIVQARTGSARLPGKVLKEVMGKPLLGYLLERLKRVGKCDEICVATTTKPQEQSILDICSRMSVKTFRGSEDDVLERYFLAAQAVQADAVVRVTSDCPLIDPVEIDKLIGYYLENYDHYDYVSHSLRRTYPAGMEAEIFSFGALKKAHEDARSQPNREHVTLYLREHPDLFRLGNVAYKQNQKDHRWTVDTPEDFELVAKILENLYPSSPEFSLEDMLDLCQRNPEWKKINGHVVQKAARQQGGKVTLRTKPMKTQKMGETKIYAFDPVLGYWGVPNIKRMIQFEQRPGVEIEIAHNDDGIRDVPFKCSDPNGTILCLGGSHTWGGGVTQEERYTNLLAHRTGRQVVNMGHCSIGIDQVAIVILNRTQKYNPKIIVVEQYPWAVVRLLRNYLSGDYIKPFFFLDEKGDLKLKKVPPIARFFLFRKLIGTFYVYKKELREFRKGLNLQEGYDSLTDPMFLYWKINCYDYLYVLLEKIIIVMRDYCHRNGIRLIFSLGVILQQFIGRSKSNLVDYDLPRNRLRNILDRLDIPYVDMTEAMLEAHSCGHPVIFSDGHINPKGHDIFATAMQKDLERRGWL